MKGSRIFLVLLVIIAIIVISIVSGTFYIVSETEQVVITAFGKPIKSVTDAGLHIKIPFYHHANYFEKRLLEWDGNPTEISAKDKVFIRIDSYARWRIIEPLKFFRSVRNEIGAQVRLDNIIDAATRDFITSSPLIEVIRSTNRDMKAAEEELDISKAVALQDTISSADSIKIGRIQLTRSILEASRPKVLEYGIDLVDMRVKRINYIESVRDKIFERMISERLRIAEKYRSEGQGEKAKIEGEMELQLKIIESQAYRDAQKIKGEADAEAIRIYAKAYERDPEFYSFLKTLETYKNTLDEKSWLMLSTESDYLKYLKTMRNK